MSGVRQNEVWKCETYLKVTLNGSFTLETLTTQYTLGGVSDLTLTTCKFAFAFALSLLLFASASSLLTFFVFCVFKALYHFLLFNTLYHYEYISQQST